MESRANLQKTRQIHSKRNRPQKRFSRRRLRRTHKCDRFDLSPLTNGKSKCCETRPMSAGRKCAESVALCVWQCHLRNVLTLSNRTRDAPHGDLVHFAPLVKLQVEQSIWQLSGVVCPPFDQGLMWSAFISSMLNFLPHILHTPPCLV